MKMLQALIMEQKEELAKLRIEHPAAVKVHNAAVEQMMKDRVEKSRVMDRMKKIEEETRTEIEVVEEMKKQLRLRGELDHFYCHTALGCRVSCSSVAVLLQWKT